MASDPVITILQDFKTNLIAFLDELIGQFPEEGDFVVMRIFLKDQVPIADIMTQSCNRVLPLKSKIKERNESVFLENDSIFGSLSREKVNHFKKLWRSGNLDPDDKETVWRWMDLLVRLMDKYVKVMKPHQK